MPGRIGLGRFLAHAVALLMVSDGAIAGQAPPGHTISYRVRLAQEGSGVTTWSAWSRADLGMFVTPNGVVRMLAGPRVGGTPVQSAPIGRGTTVLAAPWEDTTADRPGHRTWSLLHADGLATLDSLHVTLDPQAGDSTVAGHPTTGAVLSVTSWWTDRGREGDATPFVAAGTATLRFATDLPFSWLPIAGQPGAAPEAVPLATWMPELAGAVATRLAPQLIPLGLPIRAAVRESLTVTDGGRVRMLPGSETLVRSISVDAMEAADDSLLRGVRTDLPRIAGRRVELVRWAIQDASQGCGRLLGGVGGSFHSGTGRSSVTADTGGRAVLLAGTGNSAPRQMVAGTADPAVLRCLVIDLPDSVTSGTVPIGALAPDFEPDPPTPQARVSWLELDPATGRVGRVSVIEQGTVALQSHEGGAMAGRLTGVGWTLSLKPGEFGKLRTGLDFAFSFSVDREER